MDEAPVWFILIFAIGVVITLASEAIERRCPRCGTWFSRQALKAEQLGERGLIFKRPRRIRFWYQCRECRYSWQVVKDIQPPGTHWW